MTIPRYSKIIARGVLRPPKKLIKLQTWKNSITYFTTRCHKVLSYSIPEINPIFSFSSHFPNKFLKPFHLILFLLWQLSIGCQIYFSFTLQQKKLSAVKLIKDKAELLNIETSHKRCRFHPYCQQPWKK